MFFLKLISLVIPEMMNLGQNVNLNNPGSDADGAATTTTPSSHQQAPRTGINIPFRGKPSL